jgi:hypothetical protein
MMISLQCEQQPTAVRPLDGKGRESQFAGAWRKKFIQWPIMFIAPQKHLLVQPEFPGPLGEGQSFGLVRDIDIRSFVVMLLFLICPHAIIRSIWTIVILTFERFTCWAITHVGVEVQKFVPALDNEDTSSSIVVKTWIFQVVTTLMHVIPDSMDTGLAFAVNIILTPKGRFASTRPSIPASQRGTFDSKEFSAGTLAFPQSRMFSVFRNTAYRRQLAEFLAGGNRYFLSRHSAIVRGASCK